MQTEKENEILGLSAIGDGIDEIKKKESFLSYQDIENIPIDD